MSKSTKQEITDAALQLFTKHGFTNVSVNEIIQKVGISKRTFYYHFKSKDDVLENLYKIPNEITVPMLKEVLSDKTNIEKLFALNKPRIEHFTKIGQNLSKQIVISNLRDDKGTFKIHKEARQKIRLIEIDLLSSAQEENEISNMTNSEILVDTLLTSMLGNIVLWLIKPDNTDSLIDKIEKDAKIILGVIEE